MNDAVSVYKSEAVVPDQVTEVFMSVYSTLQSPQQKLQFFTLLARDFGVQGTAVDAAVQLWQEKAQTTTGASPELTYRLAEKLASAAQPTYMQLLLPVSQHKAGIAFIVQLRADLLQLLHDTPGVAHAAALRALSQDLRSALARWFSVGLMQLQRITWEDTPGQLLERVMKTEAVHHMQHMEELRRRLQQSDRRVFAFLHPSLPCEPLVVLHTAIMDHIPASMSSVLCQQDNSSSSSSSSSSSTVHISASSSEGSAASGATSNCNSSRSSIAAGTDKNSIYSGGSCSSSESHQKTVACFYSISSSQLGLSGVDLGNFLIKKAAQLLLSELPQLQHLVTLSPIPGFRAWLITKLQQDAAAATWPPSSSSSSDGLAYMLQQSEPAVVLDAYECFKQLHQQDAAPNSSSSSSSSGTSTTPAAAAAGALLELIRSHAWLQLPEQHQAALQPVLLRLCAVYLLTEKRRGFVLDPVQHFHLKNGAWLWRINCRSDLSRAGLDRSCGLMVNYKYVLSDVSANNQAYLVDQVIAAAEPVKQLLMPVAQAS